MPGALARISKTSTTKRVEETSVDCRRLFKRFGKPNKCVAERTDNTTLTANKMYMSHKVIISIPSICVFFESGPNRTNHTEPMPTRGF